MISEITGNWTASSSSGTTLVERINFRPCKPSSEYERRSASMKGIRELLRRQFFAGFCGLSILIGLGCSDRQPETTPVSDSDSPLSFSRDIKAIMAKFCFECHGVEKTESGLDLRTVESMLKGGESGPALVPGKPEESLLFKMVHKEKMPPDGDMPGAVDIERVRRWIASGARP